MIYSKPYSTKERYNMSIPNGWYAVGYSQEISNNKIKPLSILNNEFIIFRTSTGKVSVLSAYCPHQGTHLGYGGTVAKDCIICPFHRWRFNAEGKCLNIPYSKSIPQLAQNCLIAYPTIETQGMIFIYYHKENLSPDFLLPNFAEEFPDALWTLPKYTTFTMKTHIHELGENGFDIAHFQPVHRSEKNNITLESAVTDKIMKYKLNLQYPGAGMGIPFTKINVTADWKYYGLSVFSNIITLDKFPTVIQQNFYFTPQNNGEIIIRFSLRIKKTSLATNFFLKWLQIKMIHRQNIKILLRNFKEDQSIWENKIYRPGPILCDGDGPILHFRRWAQQFYSDHGPLDQ